MITQYLASRGPEGWTTHSISPPSTLHSGINLRPRYLLFTPELTAGILSWPSEAPLAKDAPEGEFENMYVHQMGAANYELVTTVAPPIGTNIYEGGSRAVRWISAMWCSMRIGL